jgi:hypothetical protein
VRNGHLHELSKASDCCSWRLRPSTICRLRDCLWSARTGTVELQGRIAAPSDAERRSGRWCQTTHEQSFSRRYRGRFAAVCEREIL